MNKVESKKRSKTKETIIRILFVVGVFGVYLGISYYDCISLKLFTPTNLFHENGINKTYALLFGSGICNTCSTGRYLSTVSDNLDIVFVVPRDYSDIDIQNFRDAFSLQGKIVRGDSRISRLVDHIVACRQYKEGRRNVLVKVTANNKINIVRLL